MAAGVLSASERAAAPSLTRMLVDLAREGSLFRGLLPVSVRAFAVNGTTFFFYERLVRLQREAGGRLRQS